MNTAAIRFRTYAGSILCAVVQFGCLLPRLSAADPSPQISPPPWARRYKEGEKTIYHMKATNRGRAGTWIYEFEANGTVKEDADGRFHEEFAWANLSSVNTTNQVDFFSLSEPSAWNNLITNSKPIVLPPTTVNYRQHLTLPAVAQAADFRELFSAMGEVGKLHPAMLGPVADLTTFYVDLMFCSRFGSQAKSGDHRYIDTGGRAVSWADGTRILVGEDSFDFDCTVQEIDQTQHLATLVINHVPAKKSQIKLRAEWMRIPVADTTNNWVQVQRNENGTYSAGVGKETFAVQIKVSLLDGKIVSARMDNLIEVVERECTDESLSSGGEPIRYQIRRQIEIH